MRNWYYREKEVQQSKQAALRSAERYQREQAVQALQGASRFRRFRNYVAHRLIDWGRQLETRAARRRRLARERERGQGRPQLEA